MRVRRGRLLAAASAWAFLGCSGANQPEPFAVRGGAPGTATVVGRIQIYENGAPRYVGPRIRPLVGWIQGPTPLTSVGLREQTTGERETIRVEDADGWFVAHLVPGRYGMGLQYYIHLLDTPAAFEVKQPGTGYCIGTLHADLAANRSFAGALSATVGGVVPMGDAAFAVSDTCAAVPGRPLERVLMTLRGSPVD